MHHALNERQQAVLDWVGQECPDGVWPDSMYKVRAQVLQSRGLIKITKRRWALERPPHRAATSRRLRNPPREAEPSAT